jgi:hypothetical protein
MKRPAILIVALVAGALLVIGAGASAHTLSLVRHVGTQTAHTFSDDASGARTKSPEPEESPEASPTARPTEKPEPAENENENEQENENENDDENNDNHGHDGRGGDDHHDGGGDDDR